MSIDPFDPFPMGQIEEHKEESKSVFLVISLKSGNVLAVFDNFESALFEARQYTRLFNHSEEVNKHFEIVRRMVHK